MMIIKLVIRMILMIMIMLIMHTIMKMLTIMLATYIKLTNRARDRTFHLFYVFLMSNYQDKDVDDDENDEVTNDSSFLGKDSGLICISSSTSHNVCLSVFKQCFVLK